MAVDNRGASSTISSHPVRDVAVSTLATTTAALPVFLVSTLAVQVRAELHFSASLIGLAITLGYLGAAVASVPAGRITERISGVRVLRVAPVAGAMILFAMGSFVYSFVMLAIALVLAGFVSAATATATNLFLARRSDPNWQGLIFGIKQAAVPLATLLGGVAVPAIALTLGWRFAFIGAGVIALAVGVSVPKPSTSLRERRAASGKIPRGALPLGPLVILGIGLGLGIFAASGMIAYLVLTGVRIGIGNGASGIIAAAAGLSAIVSRVVTGIRADRRGGAHFRAVRLMMIGGAIGYLVLAVGTDLRNPALYLLGAVVSLGLGWGWNGLFNYAVVRAMIDAPARATGITQVGGRLGGVLGPFSVGLVIALGSPTLAWIGCACVIALAAGAVWIGERLLAASLTEVAR
ncbi:MAG: MFS transporter [Acidimicrobiales bacterium]